MRTNVTVRNSGRIHFFFGYRFSRNHFLKRGNDYRLAALHVFFIEALKNSQSSRSLKGSCSNKVLASCTSGLFSHPVPMSHGKGFVHACVNTLVYMFHTANHFSTPPSPLLTKWCSCQCHSTFQGWEIHMCKKQADRVFDRDPWISPSWPFKQSRGGTSCPRCEAPRDFYCMRRAKVCHAAEGFLVPV